MSKKLLADWKRISGLTIAWVLIGSICHAQSAETDNLQENKRLARAFYDDLWFNNNTEKYREYVAETYVAHDIGDRKNVTEPAVEQKNIADFFWENGAISGSIDYQIAEDDLVATRWLLDYEPTTLLGRVLLGPDSLPIINVFRFKDGKIVELWNHRHDVDTGQTLRFTMKGFLIGILIALIPFFWALRLRRRLKYALAK